MAWFGHDRARILSEIKSPVGVLALIVLAFEPVVLIIVNKATGLDFSIMVIGNFVVFVLIVLIVGYFWSRSSPIRAGNEQLLALETSSAAPSIPVSPTPVTALAGLWDGYLWLVTDGRTEIQCHLHIALLSNHQLAGVLWYEGAEDSHPVYRGADILRVGAEATCSEISWKPHFQRWAHEFIDNDYLLKNKEKPIIPSRAYAWDCTISHDKNCRIEVRISADAQDPTAREFKGWLRKQ